MKEIRKVKRDKEAYMQDMPEAAHHDSASTNSNKDKQVLQNPNRMWPLDLSHEEDRGVQC